MEGALLTAFGSAITLAPQFGQNIAFFGGSFFPHSGQYGIFSASTLFSFQMFKCMSRLTGWGVEVYEAEED